MWNFQNTKNIDHLRQAWAWHQRTPRFLRQNCGYGESEDLFVSDLSKGLNWVGHEDGVFKALVYGEVRSETEIEGHLYCQKHTNIDFLTAIITFAKKEALKQYDKVVVEIPVKHRILHGLILRAGFFDTGMHKYKGLIHNQLFESSFYLAVR